MTGYSVQNPYKHFSITDFVTDDAFLQHQLQPTAQSVQFWQNWLVANPDQEADWRQAQKLLEAVQLGFSDYTRTYLSEEAESRLLARIQATNSLHNDAVSVTPLWRKNWISYAVAACFLVVAGVFIWTKTPKNAPASSYEQQLAAVQEPVIEKVNLDTSVQTVRLPDQTTVLLFPNSRLSYTKDFGKINRTIYLSGKAIFDVISQPQKPFLVYADDVVTRVLGTRFEVNAFAKNKAVTVRVQRGRVTVYRYRATEKPSTGQLAGVLLLPNQQVVFTRQNEQFKKDLVDNPVVILPQRERRPSFVYDETPVTEVFQQLERAYGIEIVVDKEAVENCQLTASLTDETLAEKINVICQSIGATYEIVEAQIIITSPGCKAD
ncbi:FecR family protein [Larkinella arboricola]|uniref:FecR family protein n=1 Tax=Larkinella arboricola TaxID=643671 RepID=A0A327X8W5_LARAB|nr:FecR family protein [Larkinella arboricola]RAK03201.1 FecR family protein [Larkinella arboricola]